MRATLFALPLLAAACVTPDQPVATPAADEATRQAFVEANVLAVFYHELGHALIDTQNLPVLGREEEAVDALSSVLLDALWEPESTEDMTRLTGQAWLAFAAQNKGSEMPYWDTHALDEQRYYNHVCLIVGANPERRARLAREMNLPQDRLETCADEYALAARSWGAMLTSMERGPKNPDRAGLVSAHGKLPASRAPLVALLDREVADFNQSYALSRPIKVVMESCGEENAFYDLDEGRVIICTEYADALAKLYDTVPKSAK